jgi:hypothetical protein
MILPRRLAVALLVACALAGCGGGGSHALDFGAFAGYVWTGQLHEVSTTLTVPSIVGGSRDGVAGTWVGAERSSSGGRSAMRSGSRGSRVRQQFPLQIQARLALTTAAALG